MRNSLEWLNLTAVTALVATSLVVWPELPERIPTHFGIDGRPDAWAERSFLIWMAMPVLAAVLALGFRWLGGWIARNPKGMNFPGIEKVRRMPERFREPVSEASRELMAILGTELTLIFGLIQYSTWVSAHGQDSQAVMLAVLGVSFLGSPILLAWFFVRMSGAIREAERRAQAGGWQDGEAPAAQS